MTVEKIIGISEAICPATFVKDLCSKIQKINPSAQIETVKLPWTQPSADASVLVKQGDRKCRVYDETLDLIARGAQVVAVPNFQALTFIEELQTETTTPIANIGTAVAKAVPNKAGLKIGYLGNQSSSKAPHITGAINKVVPAEWIFPSEDENQKLDQFEAEFFAKEHSEAEIQDYVAMLTEVAKSLLEEEADIILPTCIGQCSLADKIVAQNIPVVDVAQAYAEYLCNTEWNPLPKPFKIGIVGGMGPAATVDLHKKITDATPAKNDQEHFKVVVEQNPQIPDRTKYLLEGGVDPTLSLYAASKKLQADGCDCLIFPCNTAHAYLETLAPHLDIPIINMQQACIEEIERKFGQKAVIGLMATDGTCKTGIYDNKAKQLGFKLVKPEPEFQKLVMEAIYGEQGVKAGRTTGLCRTQLLEAAKHLIRDKGANVLILGCTELPLILDEDDNFEVEGFKAAVIDPTSALARKVVRIAVEVRAQRGVR